MANWLISGHGGVPKKKSKFRQAIAPTEKFKYGVTTVPWGMELVMYTPQAKILSMDYGWFMWEALMYGWYGGEDAVYDDRHKSKGQLKVVPDYRTYGDDWVDTNGVWACGIFEIGNPQNPIEQWSSATGQTATSQLSDILKAASKAKVKRVYWGCCTEFF
jgi:hypothetical protein